MAHHHCDDTSMRMLRTLQDLHDFERHVADSNSGPVDAVRVAVRGQFVRKRKLSYVSHAFQWSRCALPAAGSSCVDALIRLVL